MGYAKTTILLSFLAFLISCSRASGSVKVPIPEAHSIKEIHGHQEVVSSYLVDEKYPLQVFAERYGKSLEGTELVLDSLACPEFTCWVPVVVNGRQVLIGELNWRGESNTSAKLIVQVGDEGSEVGFTIDVRSYDQLLAAKKGQQE